MVTHQSRRATTVAFWKRLDNVLASKGNSENVLYRRNPLTSIPPIGAMTENGVAASSVTITYSPALPESNVSVNVNAKVVNIT